MSIASTARQRRKDLLAKDTKLALGRSSPSPSDRHGSRLDAVRTKHAAGGNGDVDRRGRLVVSIDKLVADPRNERKTFRNMEGLIESVKRLGIIEPPICTPYDGGRFMVHLGHRRVRAAKAAGLAKVEIIVRDPDDARTRRLKSIASNVQRENVGAMEMAEAIQALIDEEDKSQREVAKAIGMDETWVSGMLGLFKLPMPLQKKLETSQLSVPYDAAIKVARLKDAARQTELIGDLIKGATVREIRAKIAEARRGKQPVRVELPQKPLEEFDDGAVSDIETVLSRERYANINIGRRGNGRWAYLCSVRRTGTVDRPASDYTGSFAGRSEAIAAAARALEEFCEDAEKGNLSKADKHRLNRIRLDLAALTSEQRKQADGRLPESPISTPAGKSIGAHESLEPGKIYRMSQIGLTESQLEKALDATKVFPAAPKFSIDGTGIINDPLAIGEDDFAVVHCRYCIEGPTYTLHPVFPVDNWEGTTQSPLQRFSKRDRSPPENVPMKGVKVQDRSGRGWILGDDGWRVFVHVEKSAAPRARDYVISLAPRLAVIVRSQSPLSHAQIEEALTAAIAAARNGKVNNAA